MRELLTSLAGPIGLTGVVFVLDRLTKLWRLPLSPEKYPWPGVVELTNHLNRGLIANIDVPRIPVIIFTASLAGGLFVLLVRHAKRGTPGAYALALVLGGALGNIYDRVVYAYVFDWILLFQRSIVNLADISVSLGVLWYALAWQKREPLDAKTKTS